MLGLFGRTVSKRAFGIWNTKNVSVGAGILRTQLFLVRRLQPNNIPSGFEAYGPLSSVLENSRFPLNRIKRNCCQKVALSFVASEDFKFAQTR